MQGNDAIESRRVILRYDERRRAAAGAAELNDTAKPPELRLDHVHHRRQIVTLRKRPPVLLPVRMACRTGVGVAHGEDDVRPARASDTVQVVYDSAVPVGRDGDLPPLPIRE